MAITPAIKSIADAITMGFKLIKTSQDNRQVNRLKAAVDSGEKYILEAENEQPNEKLLEKYKKRFFKYNQG